MRENDLRDLASQEEIAAATAYEELHVPALFQQWAPRVVEAAQIRSGHRVLDVACGTGIVAREAASRVGDEESVTGLDASSGMLAVAERLAPAINWQQGVAESLPFEDESFDAVVSQFGLMFFEDRSKALEEMIRVLAPGGWIAVAVWESLENSQAYPAEVALLEEIAGPRAADALRAPFVLGDRQELTTLFAGAGGLGRDQHPSRNGAIPQHQDDGRGGPARLAPRDGCGAERGSDRADPQRGRRRSRRLCREQRPGGL